MDRDNWLRFIMSESGSRLVARLRHFEAMNGINGARNLTHTIHSAGRTMGYSECVEQLLSLAHCKCEEPKKEKPQELRTEQDEIADLLERVTP